jgi:tetratricopeptide (TPR) repeat protein
MSKLQRHLKRPPDKVRVHGRLHAVAEADALAVQELRRGNFQAAADIYQIILARIPNSAVIQHNHGFALQELQRYDEALASFEKAIALQPGFAEAHNSRGAVFQKLNRHGDALASYDRAIALKPDYANAHHNRGSALKQLQRHDEALASFDRAVALKPDLAEAFNNRGVVLQEMKRYDEALASFEKAIALNPSHAVAINNRGSLLVVMGNMVEAEQMFLKALALKPDFPNPWFNLVNIRKYQEPENADAQKIRALLDQPGLAAEDREHLSFTLGKIYDDCGRHDEAFAFFRQANQLRNRKVAYRPEAVVKTTNDIIEVFSRDFLAQTFAFASESQTPVFIVGMPRSGTTLLASILSNHRAVATAGELPTIPDFTARLPELNGNGIPYPQAVKHLAPATATRLIQEHERRLRRDAGADIALVIDKNSLNFKHLGFIAMLFPKARIIHCRRQPLDTGLSNYFQRFPLDLDYSFDLRNIGHFYGEYARLMEHWRQVLPLKLIEVSYEDLILNTEPTARRALDFLGLEWDERCLAPHTNPCAVETASQWQVRQPIYRQSLERWRHYEKHLAPLMEMLPPAGTAQDQGRGAENPAAV